MKREVVYLLTNLAVTSWQYFLAICIACSCSPDSAGSTAGAAITAPDRKSRNKTLSQEAINEKSRNSFNMLKHCFLQPLSKSFAE